MWSLFIISLLCLIQLISCQYFDELVKDVCFRKIYVCGTHRLKLTDSDGRFETDPFEFGGICREHKKYIACIDDAVSNNCNETMSDLALMTLNNRLSLKLFCTHLDWRKSYFSSVSCINENKDKVKKDCEYEESIHIDDRPWWCKPGWCEPLPEPCDAIQRIFNCTVQKMEGFCGATAAEVFRRIQILDANNQDVVCEFRRQNPMFCRYEHQRYIDVDPKDRVASSSSLHEKSETEAMYNDVVRAVLMEAVKILEEQRQQGFSGIIDSDSLKLRKVLSIDGESSNRVKNGSKLFKRFGSEEDFNFYSDFAEINLLRKFTEKELLEFRKKSKVLKYLHQRLKYHLFRLLDVLSYKENIIGSSAEHFVDLYWTDLEFPIQSIVCNMIASKNVFKCSIKWDFDEDELNERVFSNLENQNSETMSNVHLSDIHRFGHLIENKDTKYRDEEISYPGAYVDPDLDDFENWSEDPSTGFVSIKSATEPSESNLETTENVIAEPDSDSKDRKTSKRPKKEESLNDIHGGKYKNVEEAWESVMEALEEIYGKEFVQQVLLRASELERLDRERQRVIEIEVLNYVKQYRRLNDATRDRKREIEALEREINEVRQKIRRSKEEHEERIRQRKAEEIEQMQKYEEELLFHKKARAGSKPRIRKEL